MCGRFSLTAEPEEQEAFIALLEVEDFPPRYNIAPTQPIQLVVGWLCDRFSVYRLLAWGVAMWAAATLLSGFVGGISTPTGGFTLAAQ